MKIENFIQQNQIVIAAIIVATAIFCHEQGGKYQAVALDSQNFLKVNTFTGRVEQYCNLDNGYCQKWELYREGEDKRRKNEPSIMEYIEKRRKEEGISK